MSKRRQDAPAKQPETVASESTARPAAPAAPEPARAPPPRRLRRILGRPAVYLPLLVLVGVLAGFVVGAVRLSGRERAWNDERAALETRVTTLESALADARVQESAYRVLVSVSRVVVHLYEGNYGLAAAELGAVREAIADSPAAAATDLPERLEAFQRDLDEITRRVEEAGRSARETMREIERSVTTSLFPETP